MMTGRWRELLSVLGLLVGLLGTFIVAAGTLAMNDVQVVNLTVARFAGASDPENLRSPAAQALKASVRASRWGFAFTALGFGLQLPMALSALGHRRDDRPGGASRG